MTDPRLQPIAELVRAQAALETRLQQRVKEARRGPKPVPWQQIADVLGISRQGAYQRYNGNTGTTVSSPRRAG